jgi:fused signal recognition particle receptor
VSTLHLMMLVAVIVQLPLLGLAAVVEFSQRKKRRWADVSPKAHGAPLPRREAQIRPRPESAERGRLAEAPQPELQTQPAAAELTADDSVARQHATEAQGPPEVLPQPEAPARDEAPPVEGGGQPLAVESASVEPAVQPGPVRAAAAAVPRREPAHFRLGLRKTRENFLARIRSAISRDGRVDELYEGLEEALISADVGVEASLKIVEAVRAQLKNDTRADVVREALKDRIAAILSAVERPLATSGEAPLVIMMAGVNGVGKTTTVAKLAALLKAQRGAVVVAAADTFRAAAIEQLQVWCDRAEVDLIKQKQGSDPAAVVFDAVKAAISRKAAALIIDTAGRLQTKVNLMEELKKIARVAARELPGAPHETWLVLDATTGQNALSQAKIFGESVSLTGVVLAKLDSTAKGGVIIAIAERLKLPVRFVGLGEGIEDLREFNAREFVDALFSEDEGVRESASGTYAA